MICDLFALCWASVRGQTCSDDKIQLSELKQSEFELAMNRVTPIEVSKDSVSGMTLCGNHRYFLTSRHPCKKKRVCLIEDCQATADQSRSVSKKQSEQAFLQLGQHIPIDGKLCNPHRKSLIT